MKSIRTDPRNHAAEGDEPIAIVFREGWSMWWAEVWEPTRDPKWCWSNNPLLSHQNPPRPRNMDRVGLQLCHTRRSARRAAKRMLERHASNWPVALDEPVVPVEVIA